MSKTNCPSCSIAFEVKPEWLGRRVRCPKCKKPVLVPDPDETGNEDTAVQPTSVSWLVLGSAVVIALAVGGTAGFS
jgi:hypothetical protein